jgi:hypothetical protein
VRDWGELQPSLAADDLAKYLLLAASLRGETIEEAALPPDLRDVAGKLSATSQTVRRRARTDAMKLDAPKQVTLIRFLAASLRQQGAPDVQSALAESISALASAPGAASTAAEELQRMRHGMITAALPIALLVHAQPSEFRSLLESWRDSPDISDLARAACIEALAQG